MQNLGVFGRVLDGWLLVSLMWRMVPGPNEESRHYLPDDHWRQISLFSGVGVKEGKNGQSQTIVKNR